MPEIRDKKEPSQCVSCALVNGSNSQRSTIDKICFHCKSLTKVLDMILAEPDVEHEYTPYVDEYDPLESPEEAQRREWESLDPGEQVDAVRAGCYPSDFL